ncbi:MAG: hypothetical protein KKA99_06050 [Gammaproteobacteria bacterium]|nr:hypothetical protein [Gammaproteobacteria bacterium]MBU1558291.1 hypothetical protein [Gammaproteobacteria bacterium]MBU1629201.1 hypothetical protein [Gammaproteobacteria bacterium]MBU1926756.1 hypothetical protein [Gammaproteobacteria bacterium]MBU2546266.1 hypothetical protein [Gammaproteobacteria bacterium]
MKKIFISTVLMTTLLLTACIHVPYAQRQQYLLHVAKPAKVKIARDTIEIPRTTIAAPFSDLTFVYRTSDTQYLSDFYNMFMAPPAENIHQVMVQYMTSMGLFHQVETNHFYLQPRYVLTSHVISLYADYRNSNRPMAVMCIYFALLASHKGVYRPVFTITLSQATPLMRKDSDSLVKAWNVDLQRILKQLSYRLRRI